MEVCGISSYVPQPPEANLCPDEHMCEDKDICSWCWGQEATAGARLISKIRPWSLFIKSSTISINIKLGVFEGGYHNLFSVLPWAAMDHFTEIQAWNETEGASRARISSIRASFKHPVFKGREADLFWILDVEPNTWLGI